MIKYIGSKRGMITPITAAVRALLPDGGRVADLFSGSARVSHALKREGYAVWSNDMNAYAAGGSNQLTSPYDERMARARAGRSPYDAHQHQQYHADAETPASHGDRDAYNVTPAQGDVPNDTAQRL